MKKHYTKEELTEIENQLSCPEGDMGLKIGESMNKSNKDMIMNTLQFLKINHYDKVLEIGHGACGHLSDLYQMGNNLGYHGLDISETMHNLAIESQSHLPATFKLYDGCEIPYGDDSFDKIFTVNTLYFWNNPSQFLEELSRIIKPEGTLVITYQEKSFMRDLPFVANKFRLYDVKDVKNLIKDSAFKIIEVETKTENVRSKNNEMVERVYTMVKLNNIV